MMPTVGLEEALSDKLVSPAIGNVSTAGGIVNHFINKLLLFKISYFQVS